MTKPLPPAPVTNDPKPAQEQQDKTRAWIGDHAWQNLKTWFDLLQKLLKGVTNDGTTIVFPGNVTVAGNETVTGNLGVTGNETVTGNLGVTGTITPSQTNGIVGTTTNNSANTGSVGEYVAAAPINAGISQSTSTNLVSISLTAGDWDVTGNVMYTMGGTSAGQVLTAISTVSTTFPGAPFQTQDAFNSLSSGQVYSIIPPETRVSLTTTTTVYLVGFIAQTGACSYFAYMRARRVR